MRSGMPFVKLSDNILCENKSIQALLKNLDDKTPVFNQLENLYKSYNDKIEEYIFKYLKEISETYANFNSFIHEVSLLKESVALDKRADRITLMTLHSSKGLEFKNVFIVGLEDGILPYYKAVSSDEIEEERRLLYVGMTRAKQQLFLSRALSRFKFGKKEKCEISPFLSRIEESLLMMFKYEREKQETVHSAKLSLF